MDSDGRVWFWRWDSTLIEEVFDGVNGVISGGISKELLVVVVVVELVVVLLVIVLLELLLVVLSGASESAYDSSLPFYTVSFFVTSP